VQAWGLESQVWVGRRLTLFNDPTVLWAGQAVGGIRVKAMSNIDKAFEATHTITRGKSKKVMIQPLADVPAAAPVPPEDVSTWLDLYKEAATMAELGKAWDDTPAAIKKLAHVAAAKDARKGELGAAS
jgi:hypothetical protein